MSGRLWVKVRGTATPGCDTRRSRYRPQATMGLSHGTQSQEASGAFFGIVEGFHRRLQVGNRQLLVGAQFGNFTLMVRDHALQLIYVCLRIHSNHSVLACLMSDAWELLSPPHRSRTTDAP